MNDAPAASTQPVDLSEWLPAAQPASRFYTCETPSHAILHGPPSSDVLSDFSSPVREDIPIEDALPAFDPSPYGSWAAQPYPPSSMTPNVPLAAIGDPSSLAYSEHSPTAELLFDPWRSRSPTYNVPQFCLQILLDQVIRSVQHLETHHAGHGLRGSPCHCRSFAHIYYMLNCVSSLALYASHGA